MTLRQQILAEVLAFDERMGAQPNAYLAVHLAKFFRIGDRRCEATVRHLVAQGLLLSGTVDLVVGVKINPLRLDDIRKEIEERKWYRDPRFVIPLAISAVGALIGLWKLLHTT